MEQIFKVTFKDLTTSAKKRLYKEGFKIENNSPIILQSRSTKIKTIIVHKVTKKVSYFNNITDVSIFLNVKPKEITRSISCGVAINDYYCFYERIFNSIKDLDTLINNRNNNTNIRISKPLYQYSISGVFLRRFDKVKDACNILHTTPTTLTYAIVNFTISNGFYWSYEKYNTYPYL